jgi:hypothetical protein
MNKNKIKGQDQKAKQPRLSLNRETVRSLNDPLLLGLARGGESEIAQNCYPTTCSLGGTTTRP